MKKVSSFFVSILGMFAASVTIVCVAPKHEVRGIANNDGVYHLKMSSTNPVVNSQVKNQSGFNLWVKADSNSGVNWDSNGKVEISKNGYIQNLSTINGIKQITVDVESGSLSLFYSWKEPNDLDSPEYETGFTFISSQSTYEFADVYPSHFRIMANESTLVNSIDVCYSCTASSDENYEDCTYGMENLHFDSGAIGTYARTSYVTDDTNGSNRALKLSFKYSNNKYVSFSPQSSKNRNLISEIPSKNSTFTFDAKFSDDVTNKTISLCTIGKTWQHPGYINMIRGQESNDGWATYSLNTTEFTFDGSNELIRLNVRPDGITVGSDSYVLIDNFRIDQNSASRINKLENVDYGLENLPFDEGWQNANTTYVTDMVYGDYSRSSLLVSFADKESKSGIGYATIFSPKNYCDNFLDFTSGRLTLNYHLYEVSNSIRFIAVGPNWSVFKKEYSGVSLGDNWYQLSIDLNSIDFTGYDVNECIRFGFGFPGIDSSNKNTARIWLDNIKHTDSEESIDCLENFAHDTGWEGAITSLDFDKHTDNSLNSMKATFNTTKVRDAGDGYTIRYNTQDNSHLLPYQIRTTSGRITAKFAFGSGCYNGANTMTLTMTSSNWHWGRFFEIPLTSCGDGWYLLDVDLASWNSLGTKQTYHESNDYSIDLQAIRIGFTFPTKVDDNNKTTAEIWVDDFYYYPDSSSASHSLSLYSYQDLFDLKLEDTLESAKVLSSTNPLIFNGIRNETESAQLFAVATGSGDLSYSFRLPTLRSDDGYSISSSHLSIGVAHYIDVTSSSNDNSGKTGWRGKGWYPDALIPLQNYIQKGKNVLTSNQKQAFWFNLRIDENVKPGTYTGNAAFILDGITYEIPLKAIVHDAVMSNKSHQDTSFLIWYDHLELAEDNTSGYLKDNYFNFFLDYRISAGYMSGMGRGSTFADNLYDVLSNDERITSYRLPTDRNSDPSEYYEYLEAVVDKSIEAREAGDMTTNMLESLYVYSIDEPDPDLVELPKDHFWDKTTYTENEDWIKCKTHYEAFTAAKESLKSRLTEYPDLYQSLMDMEFVVPNDGGCYSKERNTYLNCWCPQFDEFQDSTTRAQYMNRDDNHKETWWYGCIFPNTPYPSFHLDSKLVNSRMLSYMQYYYGVSGNVYYCVNRAKKEGYGIDEPIELDHWNDAFTVNKTAGDGKLVYPGKDYGVYGPIPTIRLENIRSSYEEYEYLYMIDQRIDKYNLKHGTHYDSVNDLLASTYSSMFSGVKVSCSEASFYNLRSQILNILDELY